MNDDTRRILITIIMFLTVIFLITNRGHTATGLVGLDGIEDVEVNPPDPMTSYSYKDSSDWTTWNKIWFGSAIALYGVGDTVTTVDALNGEGCHEANPLFGEDPSTGVLILGKVVAFGAAWWVTEYLFKDDPNQQGARNTVYGIMSIIGGAVTINNASLNCN